VTVVSIASSGVPVAHAIWLEEGLPGARMFRPWLPPRLNLTGMALPALTVLIVGGLPTGGKKPAKLNAGV